jgi:hypothetical protein
MTIAGSFFDVTCDNPECAVVLRVPAGCGGLRPSFAERARAELVARNWTKDANGLDLCPACTAQSEVPARTLAAQVA